MSYKFNRNICLKISYNVNWRLSFHQNVQDLFSLLGIQKAHFPRHRIYKDWELTISSAGQSGLQRYLKCYSALYNVEFGYLIFQLEQ